LLTFFSFRLYFWQMRCSRLDCFRSLFCGYTGLSSRMALQTQILSSNVNRWDPRSRYLNPDWRHRGWKMIGVSEWIEIWNVLMRFSNNRISLFHFCFFNQVDNSKLYNSHRWNKYRKRDEIWSKMANQWIIYFILIKFFSTVVVVFVCLVKTALQTWAAPLHKVWHGHALVKILLLD